MHKKHEDEMSKYCENLEDKLCRKLMCSEDYDLIELCETLSRIHVEEVLEIYNGVYKMYK